MYSLIDKVRIVAQPTAPGTDRVMSALQTLGLGQVEVVTRTPDPSGHDCPVIVLGEDSGHTVTTRNPPPLEYLAYDPASSNISLARAETGSDPGRIPLSLEDGVCALCQCFLQRNAVSLGAPDYLLGQNLIGCSEGFLGTLDLVRRIAAIDGGVHIHGETGTGKELIARSIHYLSERGDYPFVPVNCGAFSDELLMSELFGHEKGSFTGADRRRKGLIEEAEHGTLFLDEIDSLSDKAQVVLLRYLQEKEYRPVGSTKVRHADVRIIAASNLDLELLTKQNEFREDLFFRLDILRLGVPPLRDRQADVHLLAQYYLNKVANEHDMDIKVLSPTLVDMFGQYAWPGNIRQLEIMIYRLFLLTDDFMILEDHLPGLASRDWHHFTKTDDPVGKRVRRGLQREKEELVTNFELQYLRDVLALCKGNVSKAAKMAHKERRSFIRLMEKHGLKRKHFLQSALN